MRALTESAGLARFMRAFGKAAQESTRVHFTGGASAVLLGWRSATIDIDLVFEPERDELFRAIAALKDELGINVELASPAHFIPVLPGWELRSLFIAQEGRASFYHYDFYSQALAKIERGHAQDVADVQSMIASELIDRAELGRLFAAIENELHRFPAIDARTFGTNVTSIVQGR
jgi:hypothetical protein